MATDKRLMQQIPWDIQGEEWEWPRDDMSSGSSGDTYNINNNRVGSNSGNQNVNRNLLLPRVNLNYGVSHGSSGTGSLGFFAPQQPYLIITRPELSLPDNYGHYKGYPSNITSRLGDLTGYTEVSDIHLNDLGCTKFEEDLIYTNLRNGVIIRNFTDDRPSVFTIYTNMSDEMTIGKDKRALKSFGTIRIKNTTSVNEPIFLLTDIDDIVGSMNYIYYPGFDRYYFIKEVKSVRTGLWSVECGVDVLETYKLKIADQSGVIARQEFKYNLYLNDGTLKAYAKPFQIVKKFPGNFNNYGYNFIIVGAGRAPELGNE